MIEKMKFLSITGPKTDIDRVVNTSGSRASWDRSKIFMIWPPKQR